MKRETFFKRYGALALSVAMTSLARSAEAPLAVDDAVRLALAHNPELRAAAARVDAATGRAEQAGRWSNPELEFAAEDWPVNRGGGFNQANQTIGVVQTLPYPGKKSLDRQIGGAGMRLSATALALRRTEIARDAKAAFYRVLAAEQLVEVSTQLVAVAEASAATARKRVEAGAAGLQEQLRAEVQCEQARTELLGFQQQRIAARAGLATVLGQPELSARPLAGQLAEQPDPALLATEAVGALARHPSAAAAQANVERARLEYRRARLDPYPDVKLGVSGGRIGETDQSIIQVGFSVPLPIMDRGKGRQQETFAQVTAAEAEQQAVQQQLRREWTSALGRYRAAAEQVASYRERILPKATEALRLVQTGFEQGKFGFMDLADTQRTTAEARLAFQQRLLEMNIAQAELEALLPTPLPLVPTLNPVP